MIDAVSSRRLESRVVRAHGLEQMAKNNNVRIFVVVGPLLLVCLGLHFALVHRTSRESGAAPADVAHVAVPAGGARAAAGGAPARARGMARRRSHRRGRDRVVEEPGRGVGRRDRPRHARDVSAPSAASESPAAALMPQGLGAVLPPAAPAPPAQQAPPAQPAVASRPRPPLSPRPPRRPPRPPRPRRVGRRAGGARAAGRPRAGGAAAAGLAQGARRRRERRLGHAERRRAARVARREHGRRRPRDE